MSGPPPGTPVERAHRAGVLAFGALMCGLGVTMTVLTAVRGGGLGLVLGPLFVAAGLGRIWLLRRS